jgi:hypothetical protein
MPNRISLLLILILIAVSIIFLGKSFYNVNTNINDDFKYIYDHAKNLYEKKDIFKQYLIQKKIEPIWGQWDRSSISDYVKTPPQWGHLLYFILFPYIMFELKTSLLLWFFSNLVFLYLIIRLIKKCYNLTFNQSVIFTIITISSTPFTNTISNGQLGLLMLFLLLTYWHSNKKFILGFATIKITCSAFFIFYSLIKKEISFIYFLIVYLIGIGLYCFYINDFNFYQMTNQINVLLSVNENANMDKAYDGISNLRVVLKIINIEKYYNLILVISILILGKFLLNKKNKKEIFLTLTILNLLLFYHAIYDFVLLIPMTAYVIKEKFNKKLKFFIYLTIFYFFYFVKINKSIFNYYINENLINLLGFALLIISIIILNIKKNYK